MAEAPGGARYEIERKLIQRSLEEELGARLPKEVEVRAVEETPDTIYLVLPSASQVGEGGELSEEEIESVAGGGWGEPLCPYHTASTSGC
jgi:hypothetical protein